MRTLVMAGLSLVFLIPYLAYAAPETPADLCRAQLVKIPGPVDENDLTSACKKVVQLNSCTSRNGLSIYHFEKEGTNAKPKRILALSLIHGDESAAGSVTRAWMMRLQKIDPRNTWRLIPIANPDGWSAKTRTNSVGVDLNRNFPTTDWQQKALPFWKKSMRSDKRRFPGNNAGSEPETKCLMAEIEQFHPDFIISVHTPLGVLDLDGPKVKNPPVFHPLPWISLGNFPGSLGRYMWADRSVPVLTIELKGSGGVKRLEDFDRLQDLSGTIAIQVKELTK